jgi:HEAT repeat protein
MSMLLFMLLTAGSVAQDDVVLGKTSSEWLQILREHKEPRFRRAALIALEAIGAQRNVLSGLYEALEKDAEPQVRRQVAQLLGRMGPDAKGATIILVQTLQNDKAGSVREAAATALGGKLAEQAPVPALAAALNDSDPAVRAAAAEALKNMGERARTVLPAVAAVARNPKEERHPRLYALQILGRWGKDEPEAIAVLIEVLHDRTAAPGIREAAAEGLGRLHCTSSSCVTALGQALNDKGVELRLAAAAALTSLGPAAKEAWPALRTAFKDADSGLRYQLIRAAGNLAKDQPEAVGQLAAIAQGDDGPENRLAAIQELGEAGPAAKAAEPVLTRLAMQDARARIREAATSALKKITAK